MRRRGRGVRGWRWLRQEDGNVLEDLTPKVMMGIFAIMVVLVMAGYFWSALSTDLSSMLGVLQSVFS